MSVFALPVVAFVVTRRWCLALQRADAQRLAHGYETGIVVRTPEGGYLERHRPLSPPRAHAIATAEKTTLPSLSDALAGATASGRDRVPHPRAAGGGGDGTEP